MSLLSRLQRSFVSSHAAYLLRLKTGKQPSAPALPAALRFLDYTDNEALVAVNAAYLVVVLLLFLWMRTRREGFTLRGPLVVRARAPRTWYAVAAARICVSASCGALPSGFI